MTATTNTGIRTGERTHRDDEVLFYETTEARRSTSTSELYIYIVAVVAMLIFAYESGGDSFSHEEGWWFATVMTVGYLVSRGLAKLGSSEPRMRRRNLEGKTDGR
jgi:hypothetical protein